MTCAHGGEWGPDGCGPCAACLAETERLCQQTTLSTAVPKPARRSHVRELREKRSRAKAADPVYRPGKGATAQRRATKARGIVDREQIVKQEVKRLDGYRCRWPDCQVHPMDPGGILEAAHYQAEGMGGDPTLERCTLENLIGICEYHHRRGPVNLHNGLARMRPIDPVRGMRGPVLFEAAVPGEAGKFFEVGVTEPPKGAQ